MLLIGKTEEEDIQRARRKLSILSDNTLAESLDQVNLDAKEEETTSVTNLCFALLLCRDNDYQS